MNYKRKDIAPNVRPQNATATYHGEVNIVQTVKKVKQCKPHTITSIVEETEDEPEKKQTQTDIVNNTPLEEVAAALLEWYNKILWMVEYVHISLKEVEILHRLPPPGSELIVRLELLHGDIHKNKFVMLHGTNRYVNQMKLLNNVIIPYQMSAHEVPCDIRRVAIDLDITGDNMDNHKNILTTAINTFMSCFEFSDIKGITYAIASRHRNNKKSYHVVFNGVVCDTNTQKGLYSEVCEILDGEGRKDVLECIDDIYSKRSLAMIGSYKNGRQLIRDDNKPWADHMINMRGENDRDISGIFHYTTMGIETSTIEVSDDDIHQLKEHTELKNYEILPSKTPDIIPLRMINQEPCPICNRTHTKTTQNYISCRAGRCYVLRCWRQEKDTPGIILKGPDDEESNDFKPEPKHKTMQRIISLQENNPDFFTSANKIEYCGDIEYVAYNEPVMRDYPTEKDLYIRAAMGLGKTEALLRMLDKLTKDNPTLSILVITFRKSLAYEFQNKFSGLGIESYNNIKGDIRTDEHKRVICQTESIHRLQNPYDIVILDECESILDQLLAKTHKSLPIVHATIAMVLEHSARIISMDANLSIRTTKYINCFRNNKPAYYIHNTFNRKQQFKHRDKGVPVNHLTTSKSLISAKIITSLDAGEKIVVGMTISTKAIIAMGDAIREKYPDKKIKIYTSETNPEEKKADFSDFNNAMEGVDCLIFSPSLQAGVSFTLKHFHTFYGIFSAASVNIMGVRQMMHRIRNLFNNNYFICLTGHTHSEDLALNEAEFTKHLLAKSANLLTPNVEIVKSPNGDLSVKNSPVWSLYVDTRVKNANDKKNFIKEFIVQEVNSGVECVYMNAETCEKEKNELYKIVGFTPEENGVPEYKQLILFIKNNEKQLKELDEDVKPILRQYANIAERMAREAGEKITRDNKPESKTLPEVIKTEFIRARKEINDIKNMELLASQSVISYQEAEIILEKIEKDKNITEEEKAQLNIYYLNHHYDNQYTPAEDIEINKKKIERLSDKSTKKVYDNIASLKGNYTIDRINERVVEIIREEKETHADYVGRDKKNMAKHIVNLEKTNGARFKIVADLLRLMDIKDIMEDKEYTPEQLEAAIEKTNTYISDNNAHIKRTMGRKNSVYNNPADSKKFTCRVVQYINPILKSVLGISIKQSRDKRARNYSVVKHYEEVFDLTNGCDEGIYVKLI